MPAHWPALTALCMNSSRQSVQKCHAEDQQTDSNLGQGVIVILGCKGLCCPANHMRQSLQDAGDIFCAQSFAQEGRYIGSEVRDSFG